MITLSKERIALLSLFIVEILALNVLNLGNLAWGYRLVSFILATICLIPLFKVLKEKKAFNIVLAIGSLFLYATFSALFGIASSYESVIKVSLILGVGSLFILGLFLGHFDDEKHSNTRNVVGAFYVGLALFVGLSLIVTIYNYGVPFYHVIYANEPELHEVIQKAYVVIGFDSVRVEIQTLANYALILSTGVFGLFLIDKNKKHQVFRWIVILTGSVGVLTLLFLAHSLHLYLFLILGAIVYASKVWNNSKKLRKIAMIFGFLVTFVLVAVNGLYRLDILGTKSLLDNTKYLKTLLLVPTNLDERLNHVRTVFESIKLLGKTANGESVRLSATGNILLDVLYNSGLIAFVCLTFFMFIQGIEVIKFYKNYRKNAVNKLLILVVVTTFIIVMFNAYILSTTLDFILHGILLLLGVISAKNLKVAKTKKTKTNAMSNLA